MMRRGWSLMEMMVVITLMGGLISGSAVLLTTLFRTQRSMSADIQQQSIRARIGVRLRADAHGAASAKCDGATTCELVAADETTIQYRIDETAIHREVRKGAALEHREAFPLAHSQAAFSLDTSLELPLVRLRIEPSAEPRKYAIPQRPTLLEAAVGAAFSALHPEGAK